MTTGGQQSSACRTNLPPTAFLINIPVAAVPVPGSHPHCMLARWNLPSSRFPGICIPVPAMIATNPDMPYAWPDCAVLVYANRRSELNYDLRIRRTEAQRGSDECVKKELFHYFTRLRPC